MFDKEDEEKSHPLYPKPEETYQRISLYPPKECDTCAHTSFDVEWREITKTEMKKLCKRCFTRSNDNDMWGGLG